MRTNAEQVLYGVVDTDPGGSRVADDVEVGEPRDGRLPLRQGELPERGQEGDERRVPHVVLRGQDQDGCFGPVERPNTSSLSDRLVELGMPRRDVARFYSTFQVGAPAFGQEAERHAPDRP